ncbi:MAG: cadherin-like beta sandwich domain-containing protein [Gemmatimonadetes bacterium]|nr:cadherin-like beta sandwich domain-containing protein [Gemmatimonadota bacterium]
MQAVMWNPQMTTHAAANDADIVNTMADFSFSGATVDRGDYGGGNALGGWKVSVTSGDKAVDGAPAKLGADGSASHSETVAAADLPKTYEIEIAADQANTLDGGEKYSAGDGLEYTHDGLSVSGTTGDAGALEVEYTTQTLKVGVHHERDQVLGFTGSVLDGDKRAPKGMVDLEVRYINGAGRSNTYKKDEWDAGANTSFSMGVTTFAHLPAGDEVIVVATEGADDIMLIGPDERAAYTNDDGADGGIFGEHGGFSHTVELCPLQATEPMGQDHDECSTFAYVSTYTVSGLAWRVSVERSGDGFKVNDPDFSDVVNVTLTAVEGKNLVEEDHSVDLLAKPSKTGRTDDRVFEFEDVAAGAYDIAVSEGWRYRIPQGDEDETKGATGMLGYALKPLAGDLSIDVTPTTAIVYGRVIGSDRFPLDSVEVDANGVKDMTDEDGRYILSGISPNNKDQIVVTATRAGFDDADKETFAFAANSATKHDFAVAGTAAYATVSGTVSAFGSTNPVTGVEIQVNGGAPLNPNAKSPGAKVNDIYVTTAKEAGDYSIRVTPTDAGATHEISAHKDGYTFTPASLQLSTPEGVSISGINFQAVANSKIRGRVAAPGGGPLSGVEVTAEGDNGTDTDTTGATGTYELNVPAGTYTMAATKDRFVIACPAAGCSVTVGLGQTVSVDNFTSTAGKSAIKTLSALSLSAGTLDPAFDSDKTSYEAEVDNDVDMVTVTAEASSEHAEVTIAPEDADDAADGHQAELDEGANTITVTVTAENGETQAYTIKVTREEGEVDPGTPSAPQDVAVEPGDEQATLTWKAPAQLGSSAITAYQWEAAAPGYLTRSSGATNLAADATTVDIEGLVNGVTYTFSVYAVNDAGRGAAGTATGKAQPVITLTIVDGTGTGLAEGADVNEDGDSVLAVVSVSNASIENIAVTVMEVVGDDAKSEVTITSGSIMIRAGQTAGADSAVIKAKDDPVDDDDANGMVQATATNAIDSDGDTNTEGQQPTSITITDDDTAPDAAPVLTVSDPGTGSLLLSWTFGAASWGNAEAGTRKFEYRIKKTADLTDTPFTDDDWTDVPGSDGDIRSYRATGLDAEEYTVEVRATTAAGSSSESSSAAGTPGS